MHNNILSGMNKDGMRGLVAAAEGNSKNYVLAATVGAGIGVAVTAMNERSNFATVALSAISGISYVASIGSNPELALIDADLGNCTVVGGVGFGVTAFVGAVSNALLGSDKNGVSEL